MAQRETSDIRNIAVVGHGSSGKTTFVDHLLHTAGVVNRAGAVEDGTSLSDYDPEEKERQFSIDSSVFNFEWGGKTFNIIDTPGYLDFDGAARAVMPAVETALVTVHAADGIKLNTRRMWQIAEEAGLARAILITHLDGENIRFEELLEGIRENFGRNCLPLLLPIGLGGSCTDVVNLLKAEQAPDGVVGDFDSLQEQLKESTIECDDDLMEKYLGGENISKDEMAAVFRQAVASGSVVPVLCCAAKEQIGLKETLEFLASCAPSPGEAPPRKATDKAGDEVELLPDPAAPFCARVFRTTVDVHVGKLVFFRVYSGSLGEDLAVMVSRTGKTERLGHIYSVFGKDQNEVSETVPGDILCVSKVESLMFNDTLCSPGSALTMAPIRFPTPMMSLAVEPHSRDDEEKISVGLQKLAENDPSFLIERDAQSRELVITGMGTLHLEVALSKLKRRYNISVDSHEPSTPYHETITRKGEGRYKHKKQTGGHGQYGEVYLRIEPAERGEGFEFVDEIKGGVIPHQYVPAVEKGIREALQQGKVAGYPVVDVKATVYYGSFHAVDSSEAAFKIAASRAFQLAFEQCKPVLLEPVVKVEVTIPSEFMGDVTANLSGHRGRILGMDHVGQMQVLQAEIPLAEVRRYNTELKSITGGEGSFTLEFSHYERVPEHIQQQIIASKKQQQEKE